MLTLRHSPTSPYVRKVMMVIHEKGLDDRVEREPTDPWAPGTTLTGDNPLSKVPALTIEDGTVLFDSPVIAEYLDTVGDGARLFPAEGPGRWRALRLQALGDGICDAAILRRLEANRPEALRSADWIARQRAAVNRALDLLEAEAATLEGPPTIGTLAVAAALGYLDLRFGAEDWRQDHPALAAWFARAAERDSFRKTAPPAA